MWKPKMRKSLIIKFIYTVIAVFILSSCASFEFPGVYKLAIPQGNLVDKENVDQVQIGMEPRQVRYLLGTPLIADTFNQNRWDYFYSIYVKNETTVKHHISILFENGLVAQIKENTPE